jgi:hypothetical protein
MDNDRLSWRGLQIVAAGAAYGAWLLTQHLLEATRGSVHGFTDHTHALLGGINASLTSFLPCRRSRSTSRQSAW